MTDPRDTGGAPLQTSGAPMRDMLRESAIARLLVRGKALYKETEGQEQQQDARQTGESAEKSSEPEPPLDLSWSTRHKPHNRSEDVSRKRRLTSPVDLGEERRCTYCPFVAKDSRTLYSHYQFHRQILAAPATTSSSHLEWIQTYQKDQQQKSSPQSSTPNPTTPIHSPGVSTNDSSSSVSTLRTLLQPTHKSGLVASQSASGFLKSIVQNIIRQEINPKEDGNSSSQVSSRSITPVDTKKSYCASPSSSHNKPNETPIDNVRLMSSLEFHTGARPSELKENQTLPFTQGSPTYTNQIDISKPDERPDQNNVHQVVHQRSPAYNQVQIKQEPQDKPAYNQAASSAETFEYRSTTTNITDNPRLYLPMSQPSLPAPHSSHNHNQQCTCSCISLSSSDSRGQTPECGTHNTHNESWNSSISSSQSFRAHVTQRQTKDKETQCDLNKETIMYTQADSATDATTDSRCQHCGISFDDEVIFSIHMGCHNHKDPFLCNVCGRSCGNKYGFYTHIMRGHEYP